MSTPLYKTRKKCVCGREMKGIKICPDCKSLSPFVDVCKCGRYKWKDVAICNPCSVAQRQREKRNHGYTCVDCGKQINPAKRKCSCGGDRANPRKCPACGYSASLYAVKCYQCHHVIASNPTFKKNETIDPPIVIIKRGVIGERTRAKPPNPYLPCPGYDLHGKHHKCPHGAHPRSVWRENGYERCQCSVCWSLELGLPPIIGEARWENVPRKNSP